ncbi:MAG: sigma-70 region 4 domain-containing protein [Clostridia bacterium]|nr:sigma-70 region 4 domain-containing protein [Clostridia bacterium]
MNQEMWSKTLLSAYKILPTIVKSIDRRNMNEALGSFSYQGNTMDVITAILNNNKRKEALINAKVIVDNALASLKPSYRRIIELKFMDRMKCEDIAKVEGMCIRNVFRRQSLALECFSKFCLAKGYDCEWLEKRYSKDPVFIKIIERVAARTEKDSRVSELKKKTKQIEVVVAQMFGNMQNSSQVVNAQNGN